MRKHNRRSLLTKSAALAVGAGAAITAITPHPAEAQAAVVTLPLAVFAAAASGDETGAWVPITTNVYGWLDYQEARITWIASYPDASTGEAEDAVYVRPTEVISAALVRDAAAKVEADTV